jgi:hypothetical protein
MQIYQVLLHNPKATLFAISQHCNDDCTPNNANPLLDLAKQVINRYQAALDKKIHNGSK